jgi:hypothetical protein
MTRLEAIGTDAAPAWYDNEKRTIFKSTINSNIYEAKMYRRSGNDEDPLISLEDYFTSAYDHGILYSGDSDTSDTQDYGAFVLTRNFKTSCGYDAIIPTSNIDGGDWEVKRFVPGNGFGKWHPAKDQLIGTAIYGTKGCTTQPWSEEFESINFDQFLFVSGDFN